MKLCKPSRGRVLMATWLAGSLALFVGTSLLVSLIDPDAQALRTHPVRAQATVIDVFIDGFGGDPSVDYRYRIGRSWYTGFGSGGELGNGDVLRLHRGDRVNIEYAAERPSISCPCDAPNAMDQQVSRSPLIVLEWFSVLSFLGASLTIMVSISRSWYRRWRNQEGLAVKAPQ